MEVETTISTFATPSNCRDGPRYERGITDFCCCALYIVFCVGVLALFLVFRGRTVSAYERPFDYDHQPCLGDYPYLYISPSDHTKTACVDSCPREAGRLMRCRTNSRFAVCPHSSGGEIADNAHHLCYSRGLDVGALAHPSGLRTSSDAIMGGGREVLASAAVVAVMALALVLTTFVFPELMTCLYLILFELLLAAISVGFFYRFFKGKLPFVDSYPSASYQSNIFTLLLGVAFAAAFVVSVIILLRKLGKVQFVVTVLKVARRCLWENLYMIVVAFLLSAISIGVLALNLLLIYTASASGQVNPTKHGPYDQFEYSGKVWWVVLVGVLYLWTHGLMIAISDFLFEGFATFWYFNERVYGPGYGRCGNFTNTIKLLFWHFGTMCMGAILTYLPETLFSTVNHLEYDNPRFYNMCCCCHKNCLRYLSKYCYIQTILQSYAFWPANEQLFYLRRRVKQQVPQLYMMGNFY